MQRKRPLSQIEREGFLVQIGLVPNTGWLQGTPDLSPRGEIMIDGRGATSVPGVYAARDACWLRDSRE